MSNPKADSATKISGLIICKNFYEVITMYSLPITAVNKNGLIEIFETLSHFPNIMMIKSGDYTVDAHSLIGVLMLDIHKPMELILEEEPDSEFRSAISRFIPAQMVS